MTSQGSAHGRFQRAIRDRHLRRASMAARELGTVSLVDALALTLLTADFAVFGEKSFNRPNLLYFGEVLGLSWADVDFDGSRLAVRRSLISSDYEIEVSEPKTEKGRRVVALDLAMVAALRDHQGRQLRGKDSNLDYLIQSQASYH